MNKIVNGIMAQNKAKLSDLVYSQCCICESDDAELVGSGKDFEYNSSSDTFFAMKCNTCGLVYLNPHPGISEFKKIYPQSYHAYNFSKKQYRIVYKIRSWLEAHRLLRSCKNIPANAKILDIGCGDGFHLKLLMQYGNKSWALEGIDMDDRAIQMAQKSGLIVHRGTVESVDLPRNNYDLVFMIQTIEHVAKPFEVLQVIYKLLKPGGKLLIVTDNTDSIDFRFFKRNYWGGYHFPRHWNLFNRNSLSRLAEKCEFEVVKIGTQVSPVNWVYTIHNFLVDKRAPKWLINQFTLKSFVSLTVFTVLDIILQRFRRGALLRAVLRRPVCIIASALLI